MDEGRHNDSHDGRKRPPERKPRFQFSLERRPEAIRAPLPKLGSSSKPVVTLLYDDVFSVSVDDGPDFGKGVKIEPGKVFKRLEISEEEVSLIASKFDFSDRTLLRVLIGIAGDQSRPSEDYGVSNGVLEFGASKEEFDLLKEIDESSERLACALKKLAPHKRAIRKHAISLIAITAFKQQLLDELDQLGERLSELGVTECPRSRVRPKDGQKRRVVSVLAWGWPGLTGQEPTPYQARFQEFVGEVCKIIGLLVAPSETSLSNWFKEDAEKTEGPSKTGFSDD